MADGDTRQMAFNKLDIVKEVTENAQEGFSVPDSFLFVEIPDLSPLIYLRNQERQPKKTSETA